MHKFKIFSDSSCDLSLDLAAKLDIELVPFNATFDGKTYYRENIDISITEFYRQLRTSEVFPKTSLPSIEAYADVFKKVLADGMDILCFCISSKLSGSYQSACNARAMVMEEYPEREIHIVDSMLISAPQGALIIEASKMRDKGLSVKDVADWCNETKQVSRMIITLDSLEHLQAGGRIGKSSVLAGGMMNIKPIIVLCDGELMPFAKVRGRKKAISDIVDLLNNDIGNQKEKYIVRVMHSDERESADEVKEILIKEHGYEIDFPIVTMGITIGAHVGPTAVAISYTARALFI